MSGQKFTKIKKSDVIKNFNFLRFKNFMTISVWGSKIDLKSLNHSFISKKNMEQF
jgi:hypothetical protein